MRMELQKNNTETHGELSKAHFGISSDDQAHIINILRDRLYSDKVLAVLREYGANAWDAHIEAGIPERPIKVVLPSRFNTKLTIRDFGPGISETDIYDVYCKYGKSTKRDSNMAVGMLGIGCKSGFAYADVFTVTSWHDGYKKQYSAFIDDTNLGQMVLLHTSPCGAETGIEIGIDVKPSDVQFFTNKAKELFRYFTPQPEINTTLVEQSYTAEGTGWKLRTTWSGGPVVVMGTVGYPIQTASMKGLPEHLKKMLNAPLNLYLPIGSVDITASREGLEYKEKTISAIHTALELVSRELRAGLEEKMSEADSLWDAQLIYWNITNGGATLRGQYHNSTNLMHLIGSTLKTWKGHDLTRSTWKPLVDNGVMEVRLLRSQSQSTEGEGTKNWRHDQLHRNLAIALVDVKSSHVARALKMRDVLGETDQFDSGRVELVLVKFKSDDAAKCAAEYASWAASNGIDGMPAFKLSTIDVSTATGGGPRVVRKKTYKKVFTLNASNWDRSTSAPSDNWEPAAVDLKDGTGIWMEIHGFKPVDKTIQIVNCLARLEAVGVDLATLQVVGVKPKEKDKVGDNWITFSEYYAATIKNAVTTNTNTLELLETKAYDNMIPLNFADALLRRAGTWMNLGLASDHEIVRFYMSAYKAMKKQAAWSDHEKIKARIIFGAVQAMPLEDRPVALYNWREKQTEIAEKYPMLINTHAFHLTTYGDPSKLGEFHGQMGSARRWTDYITLIDEHRNNT